MKNLSIKNTGVDELAFLTPALYKKAQYLIHNVCIKYAFNLL